MEIEVRIYPMTGDGNLKAFASATLDKSYCVNGLRVLDGEKGLWVGMPSTKDKKGEFRDVFHPINSKGRQELIDAVLAKYKEEVKTKSDAKTN